MLVTGARGFIGRSMVDVLLSRGWEVHALASSGSTEEAGNVFWHTADLLSGEQTDELLERIEPSHLVHLAWAPRRGIYHSLENFRWVEASLALLRAFAARDGQRALFVGTCAEYDWSGAGDLAEGAELGNATAYGAAKASLSRLFTDFCSCGSLSGTWARLFFLFGPGERRERLVSSVITSLLHGEPALCTHGEQLRDYLSVVDAAEALAELLASTVQGPINVASGEAIRVKDLVATIAVRLKGEHLVRLAALPARTGDAERVVADVTRLRQELGWQPAAGLEERIEETIDWWTRRVTH